MVKPRPYHLTHGCFVCFNCGAVGPLFWWPTPLFLLVDAMYWEVERAVGLITHALTFNVVEHG